MPIRNSQYTVEAIQKKKNARNYVSIDKKKSKNKPITLKKVNRILNNIQNPSIKRNAKRKSVNDLNYNQAKRQKIIESNNDEVIFVNSHTIHRDAEEWRTVIDTRQIDLKFVDGNVFPVHEWLEGDSLDSFTRVFQIWNPNLITQSVLYLYARDADVVSL